MMRRQRLTARERVAVAVLFFAAYAGAVCQLRAQSRDHIAMDTSVMRRTVAWVRDWAPEKHFLECVATHVVGVDSSWAWVQDSVVALADSEGCPPGLGIIVLLDMKFTRLGKDRVLPLLVAIARRHRLPWLCGVAGLLAVNVGRGWESAPLEWCVYRAHADPES